MSFLSNMLSKSDTRKLSESDDDV